MFIGQCYNVTMTSIPSGLSQKEARFRLARDGYNELPSQKKHSSFAIFLQILAEPMLVLLLIAGTLYFAIGEISDAFLLCSFIIVVIGITFWQERKTERTLERLQDLTSPRAYVIRGADRIRIPGREVVVGDIIILQEGDRVPADATIIDAVNLFADESLLTGESVPVRKAYQDTNTRGSTQPGGDDRPYVYSGSMIVSGRGLAQVTAIGIQTHIGRIGRALLKTKEEETLLHRETCRIVRLITIISLFLVIIIVGLYGFLRGDWTHGLISALTLSMAILPEEFPVVLLIFLTLGAWRLSKRKVLTRRPAVIETLGASTVLCVDKTGTITKNHMSLVSISDNTVTVTVNEKIQKELPEAAHPILEYGILASQRDPFDPIEKELKRAGNVWLHGTNHIHNTWKLTREYPLSRTLFALSHVWRSPNRKDFIIAAKGAPEAIADICHLSAKEKEALLCRVHILASQGMRVLGVAKATFQNGALPTSQHDFAFTFVGLLGFADPVRPNIAKAVSECYGAGMRVIMITGDYPGTARHIARSIGLSNSEEVMTGQELESMSLRDFRKRVRMVNIFARIIPEQKLRIVEALKANGDIVVMTGDGVNDAPAIKSAHVGIAMGERGTDVAREASSLVLLNDDFTSIVAAVRMGRTIFDNLKKAMSFIIAVHIPIAGMSVLPLLLGMPAVLLPAHIAFLELIIDPSCSMVFEAQKEEEDVMKRPPRGLYTAMFTSRMAGQSFLQGGVALGVVFSVFAAVYFLTKDLGEARTIAFTTLVIVDLLLIITNLSLGRQFMGIAQTKNPVLPRVVFGAMLGLAAMNFLPFLRNLFHFTPLHTVDFLVAVIAGGMSLCMFEMMKFIQLHSKSFQNKILKL